MLKLLCLLTASTKAEESSILDGAMIYNSGDFNSAITPNPDMFISDGFKTMLYSYNDLGYLGDNSREVKIKMTETHTVITVFFLQRNDCCMRRSDNSEVWVGDDGDTFSSSFT